jgi:DNA polymerase-3 subunit delta
MAPTSQLTYRQILADIKKKKFAPAYILSGEEAYYLDLIADALQEYVVEEEDRDFNMHLFYGNDADIDMIINTAQQYPVMAPYKLVILREAQTMVVAKTRLEKLEKYFQNPCSTTILAIVYKGDALSSSTKWIKAAQKANAIVYNSQKLRDYQVEATLKDYCNERRINVEPKASAMLCDHIGADLSRLFGEIEKLKVATSAEGGNTFIITAEMVEKHIGVSKEFNNFELSSALMTRNYAKAMQIVDFFGKNTKANPLVLSTGIIFNTFQRLMQAHYLPDKSEESIRKVLKINYQAGIRELGVGMKNYSPGSCLRIIHAIREFDRMSKGVGSMQKDTELIKELIYKIFTL